MTEQRHSRILDWSDERAVGDPIMVTLVPGWAFDPAEDESAAGHVRGFNTVKEAMAGVRAARPCRCGRCRRG